MSTIEERKNKREPLPEGIHCRICKKEVPPGGNNRDVDGDVEDTFVQCERCKEWPHTQCAEYSDECGQSTWICSCCIEEDTVKSWENRSSSQVFVPEEVVLTLAVNQTDKCFFNPVDNMQIDGSTIVVDLNNNNPRTPIVVHREDIGISKNDVQVDSPAYHVDFATPQYHRLRKPLLVNQNEKREIKVADEERNSRAMKTKNEIRVQ